MKKDENIFKNTFTSVNESEPNNPKKLIKIIVLIMSKRDTAPKFYMCVFRHVRFFVTLWVVAFKAPIYY